MYSGIIQAQVPVHHLDRKTGLLTFSVDMPEVLLTGLETGASVSINGVCCTVTRMVGREVYFDAIQETLTLSNIRLLDVGIMVNIERSAKADAEIGGHLLSGHVTGTSKVLTIESSENNRRLTFDSDPAWRHFIFDKGFLAVNGASLTVAAMDRASGQFSINLIPETLERTNFSLIQEGDLVNIEIDARTRVIVDTVERVLQSKTNSFQAP